MATPIIDQSGVPVRGREIVLSVDGTKVAFVGYGPDLVLGDSNGVFDIFVQDVATGAITRVSTDPSGGEANGASLHPVFSPDGTKVAFISGATNLVADDTNPREVVFSPDSTRVTFSSAASNLVAGDTNGLNDIFVKDLATGEIGRIASSWGAYWPAFSPDGSATLQGFQRPVFSADGTKSAFWSGFNIFVKDWVTGSVMAVFPGNASGAIPSSPDLSWAGDTLAYSTLDGLFLQRLSFVSIAPLDSVKPEGDTGYADFAFTVTRSGDLSQAQTVKWSIDNPYNGVAPYFGGTVPSGAIDFATGESTRRSSSRSLAIPWSRLFLSSFTSPWRTPATDCWLMSALPTARSSMTT